MDEPYIPALDPQRHGQLRGREHQPWARRAVLLALFAIAVAALLDAFGQENARTTATAPDASIAVSAPERLRGGLFYQGRFDVTARTRLADPTLALSEGWTDQMQLNTIEPSPARERSRHGELLLSFDPVPSGEHLTVWMQFEVNPANSMGRRDQTVRLLDGRRTIATLPRKVTVFP